MNATGSLEEGAGPGEPVCPGGQGDGSLSGAPGEI
jgi:hypothetical protein